MSDAAESREKQHARAVHEMFSGIAGKYDFLNHFLSLNIDKRWRKRVVGKLADIVADPNSKLLDVACGTGDLTLELSASGPAQVIGTDFCRPMLSIAHRKGTDHLKQLPFIEADGMRLSFADSTFDAVTIAFGLRNFSNWGEGVRELSRILKPGGKLAILEFSTPVMPGLKQLFAFYFRFILPRIGGAVSGSRGAYEYLPDSVSRFPDQEGLAEMMRQSGLQDVSYQNLTGGIAAIHIGTKSS
jgi:demethylmenaquinone methyltransferase / 2-methoxy-6-polyprenyl-1,4-benzoquinol methylase